MLRHVTQISLLVALIVSPALAQSPGTLEQGQKIRVGYRCKLSDGAVVDCRPNRSPHLIDGELLGIDGDVLRIRSRDNVADIALPTSSVARVWVMDGRRGSFWKGAGIGLIVGVVAGTAIGATQEFCALTCGSAAGIGLFFGAPAGLLVGGVIGSTIQSDHWRIAGIGEQRIALIPRIDRPGFVLSVRF